MDTSRGTWQEVGEYPECTAKVNKLINGKEYQFRVMAVNLQGESKPLETTEPIIAKNEFGQCQPPYMYIVIISSNNTQRKLWSL